MLHDFNPKIYTSMDYFFCIIQKTLFWGCFGALSSKWDFFPKTWLCQFFTLKAPKLHEKFQKNPISRFGENMFTYWHNDILTVVKSLDPFSPKGGGPINLPALFYFIKICKLTYMHCCRHMLILHILLLRCLKKWVIFYYNLII